MEPTVGAAAVAVAVVVKLSPGPTAVRLMDRPVAVAVVADATAPVVVVAVVAAVRLRHMWQVAHCPLPTACLRPVPAARVVTEAPAEPAEPVATVVMAAPKVTTIRRAWEPAAVTAAKVAAVATVVEVAVALPSAFSAPATARSWLGTIPTNLASPEVGAPRQEATE